METDSHNILAQVQFRSLKNGYLLLEGSIRKTHQQTKWADFNAWIDSSIVTEA